VLPPNIAILQQSATPASVCSTAASVLSLDVAVSVLQEPVLPSDVSVLQKAVLPLPCVSVLQLSVLPSDGFVSTKLICFPWTNVFYNILPWPQGCLCVLHLFVSVQQQLLQSLDVTILQQALLLL
jgi:hypothetical protein